MTGLTREDHIKMKCLEISASKQMPHAPGREVLNNAKLYYDWFEEDKPKVAEEITPQPQEPVTEASESPSEKPEVNKGGQPSRPSRNSNRK